MVYNVRTSRNLLLSGSHHLMSDLHISLLPTSYIYKCVCQCSICPALVQYCRCVSQAFSLIARYGAVELQS